MIYLYGLSALFVCCQAVSFIFGKAAGETNTICFLVGLIVWGFFGLVFAMVGGGEILFAN